MPWTNITNAQLAVGAPIRSVDLLALRDNITAHANGDAGSPQQQTAGIADNAVTAAKVNKGNGLGTSGTQLVVACPGFDTVGSYCFAGLSYNQNSGTLTAGSNYSAGAGSNQMRLMCWDLSAADWNPSTSGVGISGTWKWMGASRGGGVGIIGIACRVS